MDGKLSPQNVVDHRSRQEQEQRGRKMNSGAVVMVTRDVGFG